MILLHSITPGRAGEITFGSSVMILNTEAYLVYAAIYSVNQWNTCPHIMQQFVFLQEESQLEPPRLVSPLSPEVLLAAAPDPILNTVNYDFDLSDLSADNSTADDM